jgi:hypothetical protein
VQLFERLDLLLIGADRPDLFASRIEEPPPVVRPSAEEVAVLADDQVVADLLAGS